MKSTPSTVFQVLLQFSIVIFPAVNNSEKLTSLCIRLTISFFRPFGAFLIFWCMIGSTKASFMMVMLPSYVSFDFFQLSSPIL